MSVVDPRQDPFRAPEPHPAPGAPLWCLCIFLAASILALHHLRSPSPPPPWLQTALGPAVSPWWIHLLFAVYAFFAFCLALARAAGVGNDSAARGCEAIYPLAFYLLYYVSGILPDNFPAVFGAGLAILTLHAVARAESVSGTAGCRAVHAPRKKWLDATTVRRSRRRRL